MARIRSVKPELCESETMAGLSAEVERTFVRLWTHLDDDGRCKDDPRLIKAALFPLHDDVTAADVDAHLWTLAGTADPCLVRYEVDGKRYIACPSWARHQHPQKPRKSAIPPPDTPGALVIQAPSGTSPVAVPDAYGPVVEWSGVGEVVGVGDVPAASQEIQPPPAEPDAVTPLAGRGLEQATARSLLRYSQTIANGTADVNPEGLAQAIRRDAATDGRRATLEAWISSGTDPDEAADRLAADGGAGNRGTDGDREAARLRAKQAESATAAALAAIGAPVSTDHAAHLAEIRGRKQATA